MNLNNAFTTPQRQSKIGILLLALINGGKFARGLAPLLLLFLFRKESPRMAMMIAFVVFALIFIVVNAILQYRTFSYFIDTKSDKFIIKKGIINKKEIGIEKSKIQEVNINQPFIHKILNIYELEIDSPGSDKKEVKVNAISYNNALDIKQYLLDGQFDSTTQTIGQNEEVDDTHDTVKISIGSLLKYAITANYRRSFLAIIGFFFYVRQQISDFYRDFNLEDYLLDLADVEISNEPVSFDFFYIVIGILAFLAILLVGIIVNVVMTLVKYYGMKIRKKEHQLSLEYGLINTKNTIIARNKVQMITEKQNYLQKKWNVSYLKFSQISDGEQNGRDEKNDIPGTSEQEKKDLIGFIWSDLGDLKNALKPNFRWLIARNITFIVVPFLLSLIYLRDFNGYWFGVVAYVIILELILVFSFLHYKLRFDQEFVQVQSGFWDITKKTLKSEKIQAIKISQYIWQRKTNLGTVHIFTAGGHLSFRTAKYHKLKEIVNYSLYKVESSLKSWL